MLTTSIQWLVAVLCLVILVVAKDLSAEPIQCACTTPECLLRNTKVCNASRHCYAEYLQRNDGVDPISRGCIDSTSTLLCENRKPEVLNSAWPILVCCNEPMCNKDVIPTHPTWHFETNKKDEGVLGASDFEEVNKVHEENTVVSSNPDQDRKTESTSPRGGIVADPVYIAIAIAGLCLVVLIVVLGLFVIQHKKEQFPPPNTGPEDECCQTESKHSHSGLHRMMHRTECAGDPYICEKFFNSV
ncbi:uncharacterized protein LOC144434374 [Glandiceps talaboti]